MFAVVKTGGKQYRIEENAIFHAEKIEGNAGDIIKLAEVLMVGSGKDLKVGAAATKDAFVEVEILEQKKGDKVRIFKKKRRQNYRRTKGHRQQLTVVRVVGISADGKAPKRAEPKAKKPVAEKKAEKAQKQAAKAEKKTAAKAKKPAAKKTAKKGA